MCVCVFGRAVAVAVAVAVVLCVFVRVSGAGEGAWLTSMRILVRLRFVTPSAEVAAPPSGVKSDAVACWYTLARLHARREGVRYAR